MAANAPIALLVLAAGATAAWVGFADPPGGVTGTLRSVLDGQPVPRKAPATSSPVDFAQALFTGGGTTGAPDSAATVASSGTSSGAAVVATARKYLGVPYRYGGTNPATGLDCSALTQLVYAQHGVKLGRTTTQQQFAGQLVKAPAPGDLVVWGAPAAGHVGIYSGAGRVIHEPKTGDVCKESAIWSPSTVTYRRLIGASSGEVSV